MNSLPLDFFNPPLLGRAAFEQRVIDKNPFVVNDDVVSYRSLTCSQSLTHTDHELDLVQHSGKFSVGQSTALCIPAAEEVLQRVSAETCSSSFQLTFFEVLHKKISIPQHIPRSMICSLGPKEV